MFSIKASLQYGWEKFKENKEISLLTTLLILFFSMLTNVTGKAHLGGYLLTLAIAICLIIIKIGYTKIFLRIYDGEKPKFSEIFDEHKVFWKYLGVSILHGILIFSGFILLIIPGIIWMVRFLFASIIVIDTNVGPIDAMKESYAITKGKFWKLFGFSIVLVLVNILGFLALIIGLLVTIPVSVLASVYVYRELSKAKAGLVSTSSPQTV